MKLFSKTMTVDELQIRINELQEQEETLKVEQEKVKNELAEQLAIGGDSTAVKNRLLSISADLEMLPASIEICEQELRNVQAENQIKLIEKYQATHAKAFEKMEAERLEILKLMKRYFEIHESYNQTTEKLKSDAVTVGVNIDRFSLHNPAVLGFHYFAQAMRGINSYAGAVRDASRDTLAEHQSTINSVTSETTAAINVLKE